jgi:hypothetical protein
MLRRRTIVAVIALSLLAVVRPVTVTPTVACSCAMPGDPMADAAKEPRAAVFTGMVGLPIADGVPVAVSRWFKAAPPGPVVLLDSRGFEDPMGGMCGTNRPPAGSEWIFVAWFNERARFDVNLCSTHADLATPEGQALLVDAEAVFGPTTPIPVASAPPGDPVAPSAPAATAGSPIPAGILLMAGGAGLLVLLGGALVIAARRRG